VKPEVKKTISEDDHSRLETEHMQSIEHLLGSLDDLSSAIADMSHEDRDAIVSKIERDVFFILRMHQHKCALVLRTESDKEERLRLHGAMQHINKICETFETYWSKIA